MSMGYKSTNIAGSSKQHAYQARRQGRRNYYMSRRMPGPSRPRLTSVRRARYATNELGFVDTGVGTFSLDTTGGVTLLNTVPQGAGTIQRIGKKIMLKSLQCRGRVANNITATFNDCAILIVYDRRPNGTLPAVTDILNAATSISFNNDGNSGRFTVLKRMDFTLVGNNTTPTSSTAFSADFYLDLKGKPTVYKALGTGAIADQEQGSLLLVTVGQVAAGNTAATATLSFRLRYVDY